MVPTTPGVSDVERREVAVRADRQVLDFGRGDANERSPLCDWISGASDLTVTVSDVPPTDEGQLADADAVAAADRDARRGARTNPGIATSTV